MVSPVWKASSVESHSCNMAAHTSCEESDGGVEKLHHKKHQIFSKGLTLSNFSKSFVTLQSSLTRIAHLSPLSLHHNHSHSSSNSQSSQSAPSSPRSGETSSCSTPTSASSASSTSSGASNSSSTPSTPRRFYHHAKRPTFGRRHGHSKRCKSEGGSMDERRPVLLDKMPSGKKSEEYITVYVGIKRTQRVKYVISRNLLSHQLFLVLLKCSEDEFGQEFTQKGGIAIICDPALFVQVVKVIDDSMRESRPEVSTEVEDCPFDSE